MATLCNDVYITVRLEPAIHFVNLEGTLSLEGEKKPMKIKFYYDCGRTYTATGVTRYEDCEEVVYYRQQKNTGLLDIVSDIQVSKYDLLAYVVYDGNSTVIVKVGNCKLSFDVEDLSKRKAKKLGKPRGVHKKGGWVVWEGGEVLPFEYSQNVDIRFRCGKSHHNYPAGIWSWGRSELDHEYDIVAYRLSKGV